MRRTVSLFDFMPYGAPELIAARRAHLASALTSASAMAAMVFFAALLLSPLIRVPSAPIPSIVVIDLPNPTTSRNFAPPQPASAPARFHARSDDGIVIPVPPSDAPIVVSPAGGATSAGSSPGLLVDNELESGTSGSASEPLPEFGVYVHVDELPVAVTEFKPEYPELARQVGAEGYVVVQALVGKDGHVLNVRLDDKLRDPLFNEAALEGAKRWVFKPAYSDGHPVAVWVPIPFRFVLRE